MTVGEFADLVEKMRKAQKSYFSTRSQKALEESKLLEKQVDALIAERNKREEERINPPLIWRKKNLVFLPLAINASIRRWRIK